MSGAAWLQLFLAAIGGGLTAKFLEILYGEYRIWRDKSDQKTKQLEANFDPLLKAADELVGKLRSLAERDFLQLQGTVTEDIKENNDLASTVYLFIQFWSQVEIIRMVGISAEMAVTTKGGQLKNFFDCLESRRVRIVDRITQRAAGECIIRGGSVLLYADFIRAYDSDEYIRRWTAPLIDFLSRTQHTGVRQQVLQYYSVLHAFIDTLDPAHHVTRERPAVPGKLTKKSWKALHYRVFGVYLTFVADHSKYIGPPKRRP